MIDTDAPVGGRSPAPHNTHHSLWPRPIRLQLSSCDRSTGGEEPGPFWTEARVSVPTLHLSLCSRPACGRTGSSENGGEELLPERPSVINQIIQPHREPPSAGEEGEESWGRLSGGGNLWIIWS